jgi:short-subunit dehydrogenase
MQRTALITGASSGIGLEIARLFAADRWDVALVARTEPKLRELAAQLEKEHGITAHVVAADLAIPDAPTEIVTTLTGRGNCFFSTSVRRNSA